MESVLKNERRRETLDRYLGRVGKTPLLWCRRNLFSDWFNSALTLSGVLLLWNVFPPLLNWLIIEANFVGTSREACTGGGACWVFIKENFSQFIYGMYPEAEQWRANVILLLLGLLVFLSVISRRVSKKILGIFALGLVVGGAVLLRGGVFGLASVETTKWGGLLLTLAVAVVGIGASFPIGVLLALGRRSKMPVLKYGSILFIELWRAVPLISILFMSSVMLPLLLPQGLSFDKLSRALVGVTLFSAAYMAEVVRGGLQAIPQGQYEAASAMGFGYWKSMRLVILPQAIRIVIPGIVNTFIGLFKDTTLVLIIGLFDLLGMIQAVLTNPHWLGFSVEGYVFAGACFWLCCFGMSRYSQSLERQLATESRRRTL